MSQTKVAYENSLFSSLLAARDPLRSNISAPVTKLIVVLLNGFFRRSENIKEVIKFCAREKLVLFADEVYQETVFTNEVQFHSCRKVVRDLGPEYDKFQLMSINSASKGFYGE